MPTTLEAVRPITLAEVREARARIAAIIVRTPLVRLELGPDHPDIRLKLENLQPINAYKLRGAANAVALLPEAERRRGVWTISASIGGGGLITGVGSAMKALKPGIKVWGAEPETAAPAARSFAMGGPQVFKEWQASFVDGAGGQSVFPRMWQRMRPVVDGCIVVSLEETKRAMRLMAEKARIVSEGAGALPLAAALTGKAGPGPIVAIVSGGNIDLKKFAELIGSA